MKKTILLLAFLLSYVAQAQWVKQSNFSGTIRYGSVDFVVNDEAYITGGLIWDGANFIAYDQLWKYDAANDSWAMKSNYPGGNMYAGVSFVIDGIAYVGLGSNQNAIRNKQLWAYDPSTDTWAQKASFPGNGRTYAFSFAANGKGYVGAGDYYIGLNRVYLNDFWEYDPANDSWTQRNDYPGGGRVGMAASGINDKGYVGMGDDGGFFYTDFYAYDASSNTWSGAANFPGQNRSFYAATAANGKAYVIGGEGQDESYVNQMWRYNPETDNWSSAFNFTSTSRVTANLYFVDNAFYYGLGLIGSNSDEGANDLWKYEMQTVGLTPMSESLGVKVYPVPTSDQLHLDFEEPFVEAEATLTNLQGQVLQAWSIPSLSSTMAVAMQVPEGVYFMHIRSGDKQQVIRVVKQ